MTAKILLFSLLFSLTASFAHAGQTTIAVAANFTATAKDLAAAFQADTGHKVRLSFGSTGKLYAQVIHGAPFAAFLAADTVRPQRLITEGHALPGSLFTYATGKIVLFSKALPAINLETLNSPAVKRLALATPKTAPYGAAAQQVMQKYGLFSTLRPKLVKGENIAQTYQFVMTQNAQAGFVALSQVIKQDQGSRWMIPETDYTPIAQQAVLLNKGQQDTVAKAFLAFLKGPKATAIIQSYGYGTPDAEGA